MDGKMMLLKCIFGALFLCWIAETSYGCRRSRSCEDLQYKHRNIKSGEYFVYNRRGQRYKVYCEFHRGYGYTFVSKDEIRKADMRRLRRCHSKVLVRHLRSNGKQYDTMMDQISSRSSIPLSVQYNKNTGYATPINHATMGPYLYLGFLPKYIARSHSIQGYRANGQDFTFRNCDANPNSYLALFVNPKHNDPNGYYKRCCYTKLMRDWINVDKRTSEFLPCNYFFQFEMHMGGCGGYAVNGFNTLTDVIGAALGFQFETRTKEQNEKRSFQAE